MKRPSPASLKRVNVENLEGLGATRLAELLVDVAGTRPELKRRLRMELAAAQGPEHLLPEIDRRLTTLGQSRGSVSWRQKPAVVRDLEGLRNLIAGTLAGLDGEAARDRILRFMALSRGVLQRVRDKDGNVGAVFERAAGDVGRLYGEAASAETAAVLAAALAEAPAAWSGWGEALFAAGGPPLAQALRPYLGDQSGPAWSPLLRHLADAVGDPALFARTFSAEALRTPSVAAAVARRHLAAGDVKAAGAALDAAVSPGLFKRGKDRELVRDPDWEAAWIEYLEASGQAEAAQGARWAAFERSLDLGHAKAFTARLPDFEDVEAEQRIFDTAARHADAAAAMDLLVAWPALREAAALADARPDDLEASAERYEAWASALRRRSPATAYALLRRAAAQAFRRRDFAACDRLTEEAEALGV